MTRLRLLFPASVAALGLGLAFATPAYAHAYLQYADPAKDAVVKEAPAKVTLDFTEEVAPRFTRIEVFDAAGKEVDRGDSHPEGKEGRRMAVSLPPLAPGKYEVRWQAVSADDGHHTSGRFFFTVAP